ncbi:MAG: hypothetical protein ACTHN3_11140 [Solirubrobacterales bacterium]
MSKKIILLALAAVSAAVFVLPATAMAAEEDVAVHVVPLPGASTISGGATSLSTLNGQTVDCTKVTGTATWENTTTGHLTLMFEGCKATVLGEPACTSSGAASGTITTTENLQFHQVTAKDATTGTIKPAVLITPKEGHFATFTCSFLTFKVTGTGIIGEIENACGSKTKTANINFAIIKHGEQTFRTVVSNGPTGVTSTEYDLLSNGETAGQTGTGTITFANEETLECT